MELVAVCQELWRRRRALTVAFVVALLAGMAVVYHLPSLKKRSLSYGAANTQFLLDSTKSSLANAGRDLTGLATRAAVFTRFMTSPDVQRAVAAHAGVPAAKVEVDAPVDPGGPQGSTQPPSERRSGQLAAEADRYRVFVQNEQALPIVDVYAQGPDTAAAVRLANAAVAGIKDTLGRMQAAQTIPPEGQLMIQQLGPARGGMVTQSGSKLLAVVVFLFVFVLACAAIVAGARIVDDWRRIEGAGSDGRAAGGRRRRAKRSGAVTRAARIARSGVERAPKLQARKVTRAKTAAPPKAAAEQNGGPPAHSAPSSREAFAKPARSGGPGRARERGNGR